MFARWWRAAARTEPQQERDGGVAMLAALLIIMIFGALSVLMLGVVLSQVTPTQFSEKYTRTIYAAEAGVEVTLSRIRTATGAPDFTGKIYGDPRKLPCTLTGVVDTTGSGTTYTVNVQYFADDPAGQTASWRTGHAFACSASNGTGTVLPSYAYITSRGQAVSSARVAASEADRGISMIYQFETTTKNVKGGRIYSWNDTVGGTQLCLRADSATAGSSVSYRPQATCGTSALEDLELWVYDTDYSIKLASSTLTATTLCLTTEGTAIKLRSCATPNYTQQWSWHQSGNATWVGQTAAIADSGQCLGSGRTTGTPLDGDKLQIGTCANQAAWGSFSPDPAVGPGAASANTHQIVNYLEFGRCFDVTDTDVNKAFMISYPCKQDPPAAAQLYWNHKWFYNEPLVGTVAAPQLIYVYNASGVQYCLKTPTTQTNPNLLGVGIGWYPTLTSSCNISDTSQQWTRSMATGSKTTSWTFRDSSGRCIGAAGDKYKSNWTALVVSACDGSTAQKWNAPADNVEAEVGNYLEETG